MRSRNLTKRFELFQTSDVSNGFAGNTVIDTLITSSWAEIRSLTGTNRSTDFGITDTTDSIIIKTRKRLDLAYNSVNQFIKYRGDKYTIVSKPYDVNFDNLYIEFVCTKQKAKNIAEAQPIGSANIATKTIADFKTRVTLNNAYFENDNATYTVIFNLLECKV